MMKQFRSHLMRGALLFVVLISIGAALAEEKEPQKLLKPVDENNPLETLISGKSLLQPEFLAMQEDDYANPGMLVVKAGEALWGEEEGLAKKSCAFCHNEAKNAMAGVGARYPVYNKELKKPISLEQRINLCREKHMKVGALDYDSEGLIALTTFVKHFSRGRPVGVKVDGKMAPFFDAGRKAYHRRRGQLNMSCAQCHEDYQGKKLRSETLSQGHSNGYPAYSLRTSKVQPLHQKFQMCNRFVRSEPHRLGSDEYVNLELYLAWRGSGLDVETPAVRN